MPNILPESRISRRREQQPSWSRCALARQSLRPRPSLSQSLQHRATRDLLVCSPEVPARSLPSPVMPRLCCRHTSDVDSDHRETRGRHCDVVMLISVQRRVCGRVWARHRKAAIAGRDGGLGMPHQSDFCPQPQRGQ